MNLTISYSPPKDGDKSEFQGWSAWVHGREYKIWYSRSEIFPEWSYGQKNMKEYRSLECIEKRGAAAKAMVEFIRAGNHICDVDAYERYAILNRLVIRSYSLGSTDSIIDAYKNMIEFLESLNPDTRLFWSGCRHRPLNTAKTEIDDARNSIIKLERRIDRSHG